MQHDHILKKFNFNLLSPPHGRVLGFQARYLLPYCCIRDPIQFDMKHDHVLKKLNFDLLTPPAGLGGGGGGVCGKIFATICCILDSI